MAETPTPPSRFSAIAATPSDDPFDDADAPPVDSRTRVWGAGENIGRMPATPEELRQFGHAPIVQVPPKINQPPLECATSSNASLELVRGLIAKFPDFDPAWPVPLQQQWFVAYEKLLQRGLAL